MNAPRLFYATFAACLLMLAAVGCAKASEDQSAAPTAASPAPAMDGTVTERKLIRTATLSVRAQSPDEARRTAERLVRKLGGHTESSEARGDADHESLDLVLRIPTAKLERALDSLRRLGEVEHESMNTSDVTEQHVDLVARLKTQRALEKRYVELLAKAQTVEATLKVEAELSRVREEIERLEGKQRVLDGQVALSTISLHLSRQRPLVRASASDLTHASQRAYADAINVSGALMTGGIRAAGMLAPVLFFVLLPLGLGLRFGFRRLRKHGLL